MGLLLQILTVIASLGTAWFLSKKGLERWGYLIGFCALPLWVAMELFYQQWFYLILNPIYFIIWFRGLKAHWHD